MWLRATTSLWFNGQFELYPTNITASYEPSEFAWQIALISLQHLRLCFIQVNMWLRATTEQQAQSRSGENEPSERGKHIIYCFLQKWKKYPKAFVSFLQFAKNHNKILTDFLQKVAICQTDVPDHAATTPTHPRSDQSPSTVRITKKIEFYKADDALFQILFATQGDFRGLVPSENGDYKTGAASYVESDFDLNIVCRV